MNDKILIEGKFSQFNLITLICCLLFIPISILLYHLLWIFGLFLGLCLCIVPIVLSLRIKPSLTVTDSKVVRKTILKKKVLLPIDQISAVGTGLFKRVTIATSSGSVRAYFVSNNEEVFAVISELLVKRQAESKMATSSELVNI